MDEIGVGRGRERASSFYFNDTATPEIYTLSLHDALPICYNDDIHYKNGCLLYSNAGWASVMLCFASRPPDPLLVGERWREMWLERLQTQPFPLEDRKSTRPNSSHSAITYAVSCLKQTSFHHTPSPTSSPSRPLPGLAWCWLLRRWALRVAPSGP